MKDNFTRYSRQIFIEEIGVEGQRKIRAAKVLVIGAGGLGSPVIQYLAAAGVGTLAVADFDTLEIHNLNRQVIYQEKNVGKPKVESASEFVSALNSDVHFIPIKEKITIENVQQIIHPYDIVIDGSDNFTTRYLVNDACVQLGKLLVYGSILSFEGQVAVFNYKGSKNLRDIFLEPPNQESLPDCDSLGVLGPLPGIVGSIMAMQTLQIICDMEVLCNELLLIDTKNWAFNKVAF
ncbi:HesA/MoeB/ThiF family protein [Paenimyroides baculatum]|uniref:Molybdopterin-synthase adenylyltransferase n=1 Tax=Paenimyroides baculatum TaxID=2608000 RepID=A0A5M6CAA5_9FLAO|nr:HesA/MoeB/ThiF family protein [Paenimyroides baculatum]KAA5532076.1 HesA/MoeB/ThiF family protein [Paenimyroides baculatum]